MLLTSSLLTAVPGIRHGFSTRQGGVSRGPFASWNFGGDDDEAATKENRRRFCAALALAPDAAIIQVDQVHGSRVIDGKLVDAATKADAIVESRPGVAVGVRTADCAPILIAGLDDDQRPHVAAVHAGWRGAVADVPGLAVAAVASHGVRPDRLRAAIGPTIGLDRFEVGDEVIDAATKALDGEAPKTIVNERRRHHLDLADLVRRLLIRAGIEPENVQLIGGCTFDHDELYYSYRRDGGRTGRHLSAIVIAGDDR